MEQVADKPSFWALPTNAKRCGGFALWLTVVIEGFLIALVLRADPYFLWSLKTGFPVCVGCLAALLYSLREPRDLQDCLSAAIKSVRALYISIAVLAILFLPMLGIYIFNIVYLNGLVAAVVAGPFAIGLAYLGGWIGYKLQMARWRYIG